MKAIINQEEIKAKIKELYNTSKKYDNIDDLKKYINNVGLIEHHTAAARGYVARTGKQYDILPYSGRFGNGLQICRPRWDTSKYCYTTYFVLK